jgi:hypothetical protein
MAIQIGASRRLYIPLQFPDDGTQGGGTGTPPASSQTVDQSNDQGQAATPPAVSQGTGQPNDPQAMLAGMNKAMREAAELRKQVEAYQKFGDPDSIARQLEDYQYINNNAETVIANYLKQNPRVFQALAQQLGPQAAFQAIGNQIFNQQPQDPYEKYRNIEDLGELVKNVRGDLLAEIKPMIQQELKPLQTSNQNLQNFADKTLFEAHITQFLTDNPGLGVTREQVIAAMEKGPNPIPYGLAASNPDIRDLAILKAIGGLGKAREVFGQSQVQTYQQEVINNHQQTAPVSVGGGASAVVAQAPLQDRTQIKNAMQERLSQYLAQQKT